MSELCMFFDSLSGNNEEYGQSMFSNYFSSIINDGVLKYTGHELKITPGNTTMTIDINPGKLSIQGFMYISDSIKQLTHRIEVGNNRIDRILVRLDVVCKTISVVVVEGIPSLNPLPPTLTRDSNIWEISLGQVLINDGQNYINESDIIDERSIGNLCGFAQNTFELFKQGTITPYSGLINDIPDGWALCDGVNGTPNLIDRFILATNTELEIGEIGGSDVIQLSEDNIPSHNHKGSTSSDGSHTHTITSVSSDGNHRHDIDLGDGGQALSTVHRGSAKNYETSSTSGLHSHSISISGQTHTHSLIVTESGAGQSFTISPPYLKLAFIIKL